MSYTIEKLEGEPIVFQKWHHDLDFGAEMDSMVADSQALFDEQTEPVYYITDMLDVQIGFDDMMAGVKIASSGPGALFKHPNVKLVIFVVTNKMIRMAARGMNNEIFGNINVAVFDTVDEALDFAREDAGETVG